MGTPKSRLEKTQPLNAKALKAVLAPITWSNEIVSEAKSTENTPRRLGHGPNPPHCN
jgi:hypothetical protein